MPSTKSVLKKLESTYPQFKFEPSDDFRWSPSLNTVFFKAGSDRLDYLIHELSHAVLGHFSYGRDIELLPMERDAWDKAREISGSLGVTIDDDTIEANLDSYRNWMHARSTCPACGATGLQVKKHLYRCPACAKTWKVNDARICGLRRYLTKPITKAP